MSITVLKQVGNLRVIPTVLAMAAVSACSSASGPTAGAPSGHAPQAYEPLASTVATTSTLGGSALRWPAGDTKPEAISLTGNRTGDTGRTALNDGTYLFVYVHGTSAAGAILDGAGASGTVGDNRFAGTYDYVRAYNIQYPSGASQDGLDGFAGVITAASDMPSGGSATYTGEVAIDKFAHGNTASTVHFDRGVSTLSVDFAAGTADVDLGNFAARTTGANVPISAATAPFDQITGTGMTISGAHFTGGNWVTLKGGSVVNVVGANPTSGSNGTFFGYDASVSAPDEVAGVFVINGATAIITGRYIAD